MPSSATSAVESTPRLPFTAPSLALRYDAPRTARQFAEGPDVRSVDTIRGEEFARGQATCRHRRRADGSGIAQVAAVAGWESTLRDVDDPALERGRAGIAQSLARFVSKGRLDADAAEAAQDRITTTTDLHAVDSADIVVEAVFESIEVKREVFAALDEICRPDAVLASNTSAIPITQIAAATRRPESVIGAHFFSPVPMMALCELVRGYQTSDATLATDPRVRRGRRQDLRRGQPGRRRLRHHPADRRLGQRGRAAGRDRRGHGRGRGRRLPVGLRARDGPAGHPRSDRHRHHAARDREHLRRHPRREVRRA